MTDRTASATGVHRLARPLSIRHVRLTNRFVMGSMHTNLERVPNGFERLAAFYAERARAGVGLIITGGYSPRLQGCDRVDGSRLASAADAEPHRLITERVHAAGGYVLAQLLHHGSTAQHPDLEAPSGVRSPLSRYTPRTLSETEIGDVIDAFVAAARRAASVGYDGVELSASEGFLLNQFLCPRTNRRQDRWGRTAEDRRRVLLEIVRGIRTVTNEHFVLCCRLSVLDLVGEGSGLQDVTDLARALETAGVDLLDSHVGWFESPVPTVAGVVPRGAWSSAAGQLRGMVKVPVIAGTRMNVPETAETALARGDADLIALGRPLLADPEFVRKALAGAAASINTCIACNQACLDRDIAGQPIGCVVNPRAARETEVRFTPTRRPRRIGVVGGGPAGLEFAIRATRRGHEAVIFEACDRLGGQLAMACRVPGKEDFAETIRYYQTAIAAAAIETRVATSVDADALEREGFDVIVIASGARPRTLDLEGSHPNVVSFEDVLRGRCEVGERVAVIGAGAIAVDTATYLVDPAARETTDVAVFREHWGIDDDLTPAGGLRPSPVQWHARRQLHLLQRSVKEIGATLGVSTAWIHRLNLRKRGVQVHLGVTYRSLDAAGLHYSIGSSEHFLAADTIVVCAGQVADRTLQTALDARGITNHTIGGALDPSGANLESSIRQGLELAAAL